MKYDIEVSKRLNKINLNFEYDGYKFKTYWCRVVMNESDTFNSKEHSHSFYELHLCLNGECEIFIGEQEYILKKGQYIICHSHQKHTIVSMSKDFEKLVWGFNVSSETGGNRIRQFSTNIRKKVHYEYGQDIKDILSLIFNDVIERRIDYVDTIKLKLFLLFMELFRASSKQKLIKKKGEEEKDPRLKMIESYIDDNILYGIAICDVANEFSLCERQLSRIFKKAHNVSIGKYITIKKMEKAKEILAETNVSLAEISETLGYSDAYAFGKAFKNCEGMSPIKFRNSIRM